MKEEKEKWEDIIRSKIYDFESETNPDDWDLISSQLSGGKTVVFNSYRKYGYVAAAVVAVLLVIGGLYFFPHDDKMSVQMAVVEKPVNNILKTTEKPVDGFENRVDKSDELVDKVVQNVEKVVDKPLEISMIDRGEYIDSKLDTVGEPPVRLRPLPLDGNEPEVNIPELDIQKIENEMLYSFNKVEPVDINPLDEHLTADVSQEVRHRRWSFGMGGGGYAANSTSNSAGVAPLSALFNDYEKFFGQHVVHLRNSEQTLNSNEVVNGGHLDYTEYLSGEVKHKTPVSAGLGVSYYLNERWSLQSGAVYTLLRSNGNYNDNAGNTVKWKQSLHYIGVPLSVSYKIAEWNRLQWYASAGGMCEFNVSGKVKKTVDVEGLKARENESLRMKTPMWSLNARTGVVYPLWRFINVYAEAGASYYFDNHSEIETIRSDKPFNVSLQAGIRLGF